jgi:hypothetical protein
VVRIVATPLVLYLTFRFYPFGFKFPIKLEPAIMWSDGHTFYLIPMGYSFCSSELNLTIYFAKSDFHFTYTVGLGYYRTSDIPLVYSSSISLTGFQTAISSTRGRPLYPTFVVYLRTIHGPLSFISYHHPEGLLSLNG